jgi:phospholipid/cholesterol/gamma-HCH transport system substrate-binding protein
VTNGRIGSAERPTPSDSELDRAAPKLAGGREVRVGIFVLLGVIAVLGVLFLMTDPATFRGRYMVFTEVPDAGGIRRGDPVLMRGVSIGRVHEFALSETGVVITLEIEGEWGIPSDSRTVLAGTDFLGGRPVNVEPGRSSENLPPGGFMPGAAEEGVIDMAGSIGDEARETMERVRSLLADTTIAGVQGSVRELEDLLASLSAMTDEQSVRLSELSSSLVRSAGQVEELTASEELPRTLARMDSTFAELRATSARLSNASLALGSILGRIDRGQGTLGRLTTDDGLYMRLDSTLTEISNLARDLRENPERYINVSIF